MGFRRFGWFCCFRSTCLLWGCSPSSIGSIYPTERTWCGFNKSCVVILGRPEQAFVMLKPDMKLLYLLAICKFFLHTLGDRFLKTMGLGGFQFA